MDDNDNIRTPKLKWGDSLATYYIFEEEIIAMNEEKKVTWYAPLDDRCNKKENAIMNEEKKVNFKVGDYVLIDSMNEYPKHFGYLGIIVSGSFVNDRWGVYFFALKDMIYVDEKFLIKSKYEYEIKPKIEISLKEAYKKYIESDINVTKQALNSYYGRWFFNPERYTNLKAELNRLPKIKKVIFNGPATIVLWGDGDKTIVQCVEGDTMDKEKGLAMAICKKALGKSKTHYDYYNVFKKWIKEKKK